MAIGEVFLSDFLQVLFDRLASPYLLKFLRGEKIEKQLRKCTALLSTFKAVLADAENKQITDRAVKRWLAKLQDVAYDFDDIVDELTTEAALRSHSNEENQASTSTSSLRKVLIPACCTTFTSSVRKFDDNMVSKIDSINDRLEGLKKEIDVRHLTVHLVSNNGREPTAAATAGGYTTPMMPRVYGREAEKLAILDSLLREEQCSSECTNCEECTTLPPLGQLPKLKKVEIKGMHGVKRVGVEFYYSDRGVPLESHLFFPLLETLSIEDMPEWEVWSVPVIASDGGGSDDGQFAHLRKFSMKGCPKLVAVPPRLRLPSLVDLIIESYDGVILKSFADLTSLTHLRIEGIKGLHHLVEEEASLGLLTASLERLDIDNCNELVSLGEKEQCLPFSIKKLFISECVSLEKLPKTMSSLEELWIYKCPKLVCFPETPQGLPNLKYLTVRNCAALESLPDEVSQLQKLDVQTLIISTH